VRKQPINILFHAGLEKLAHNITNAGVALTVFANLHYANHTDLNLLKNYANELPEIQLILDSDDLTIQRQYLEGVVCEFNPLRALRPKRNAAVKMVPLQMPFDESKFHLGLDELDTQVFHTYVDKESHMQVDLMYNRYPFANCHFLWIPDRKTGKLPQYIDPSKNTVDLAWRFVQETGTHLGYNANGAHSSVNHLHLQGYVPTPHSNTGAYHASRCYIGTFAPLELKEELRRLHEYIGAGKNISYNFVILPKGIELYERHNQGHEPYVERLEVVGSGGFGFHEMGGNIVMTQKKKPAKSDIHAVYDSLRPIL
jgi:hypothetical protein